MYSNMKGWPFIKYTATFSLAIVLYLPFLPLIHTPETSALSGSDWQAGRIIDDGVFFDPNTMSAQDIQNFLNSKVPTCDTWGTVGPYNGYPNRAQWAAANGKPQPPYICLKDYSQTIDGRSADNYCSGSVSGGLKSAAQIIRDVSIACSVNPKVLIVLLQKEQSLVTDDWPWPVQYEKATGYGCPDTAPCNPDFAGFFNQIWYAARQYQRYAKQPQNYNYRGGSTSFVQYNPNTACGGTNIYMKNQSTAGLYNYTPYQPNQAALNNLYGTGDSCSAYGNRNFWRMYIDWFGSPYSTTAYAWMFEGQEFYSDSARTKRFTSVTTATPGGKIYVRVKARNMGNQTWDRSFMNIGTSRPNDRPSQFVDASWLSTTRPAKLLETSITPGGIGTFEFTLTAPSTAGSYIESFNLVADGYTWLNDIGMYFPINVVAQTTPTNNSKTGLNSGESIQTGEYLLSPDTQSLLMVQPDGNLVVYSNFSSPVWSSNSQGQSVSKLIMQPDGNLVLYTPANIPLWSSGTNGNPGAKLRLQTDGNLVLYSSSDMPLWNINFTHNPNHLEYVNTELHTASLFPMQSLETANRKYELILQPDDNLVLYSNSTPIWASGTVGRSVSHLALQPDGNLVLYDKSGYVVWHTNTWKSGTSKLAIQPDGNLVLYNRFQPTWSSSTSGAQ